MACFQQFQMFHEIPTEIAQLILYSIFLYYFINL